MIVRVVLDFDILPYFKRAEDHTLIFLQEHIREVLTEKCHVRRLGVIKSIFVEDPKVINDANSPGGIPESVAGSVERVHRGREDSRQAVVDSSDGDLPVHPKGGGVYCTGHDAAGPITSPTDCSGACRVVQRPESEASPLSRCGMKPKLDFAQPRQGVKRLADEVIDLLAPNHCKLEWSLDLIGLLDAFAKGIDAEWEAKIKGIISRLTEIQKPPKLTGEAGGLKGREEGAHGA